MRSREWETSPILRAMLAESYGMIVIGKMKLENEAGSKELLQIDRALPIGEAPQLGGPPPLRIPGITLYRLNHFSPLTLACPLCSSQATMPMARMTACSTSAILRSPILPRLLHKTLITVRSIPVDPVRGRPA